MATAYLLVCAPVAVAVTVDSADTVAVAEGIGVDVADGDGILLTVAVAVPVPVAMMVTVTVGVVAQIGTVGKRAATRCILKRQMVDEVKAAAIDLLDLFGSQRNLIKLYLIHAVSVGGVQPHLITAVRRWSLAVKGCATIADPSAVDIDNILVAIIGGGDVMPTTVVNDPARRFIGHDLCPIVETDGDFAIEMIARINVRRQMDAGQRRSAPGSSGSSKNPRAPSKEDCLTQKAWVN